MGARYSISWAAEHGLPRVGFLALRGMRDPFARLMSGDEGYDGPYSLIDQLRGDGGVRVTRAGYAAFDYELCREILRDTASQPSRCEEHPYERTVNGGTAADEFPLVPANVLEPGVFRSDPGRYPRPRGPPRRPPA